MYLSLFTYDMSQLLMISVSAMYTHVHNGVRKLLTYIVDVVLMREMKKVVE
jgi:hypothetical protein